MFHFLNISIVKDEKQHSNFSIIRLKLLFFTIFVKSEDQKVTALFVYGIYKEIFNYVYVMLVAEVYL